MVEWKSGNVVTATSTPADSGLPEVPSAFKDKHFTLKVTNRGTAPVIIYGVDVKADIAGLRIDLASNEVNILENLTYEMIHYLTIECPTGSSEIEISEYSVENTIECILGAIRNLNANVSNFGVGRIVD
jgi:hypothetical protein